MTHFIWFILCLQRWEATRHWLTEPVVQVNHQGDCSGLKFHFSPSILLAIKRSNMEVILSKSTRTIAAPALIQSWVSSCFASNSNSNFSLRISHIPFIKDGFRTREEFELLHYSLHGIFGSQRPTLIVVHPTKNFLHFISFLS